MAARRTLEDFVRKNSYIEFRPKSLHERYSETTSRNSNRLQDEAFEEKATVSLGDPFAEFSERYLPRGILSVIKNRNYSVPTPVQAQTWPILLQGRDLLCTAPTGSGKTLAYLVPALIKTQREMHLLSREGPLALILSPTRELAIQTFKYVQSFDTSSGVHSYCVHGGVPKPPQIRNIQQGGGICVATPGRMNDFLRAQVVSLRNCSYIVLDEADIMLKMDFLQQIQNIINHAVFDTQIVMFSATWKEEFNFLQEKILREYIVMKIGPAESTIPKNICQVVELCQESCKWTKLNEALNGIKKHKALKVLIFTNTRKNVADMTHSLRGLGWYVIGLHSEMMQEDRHSAVSSFRLGLVQILVTTDVVSRGMDIQDVKYVINFDFPVSFDDYSHRAGRTGRNGESGTVYTIFTYADRRHARNLINIFEATQQFIPTELRALSYSYEAQVKNYEGRRRNTLFRSRRRLRPTGRPIMQMGLNIGHDCCFK